MRIDPKALGVALLAAFAMSAGTATAAQAAGNFTAEEYPAIAKGQHHPEAENYFEITQDPSDGRTACDNATYEATLTADSNELTVTPHYSSCNGRTLHLNGCDFRFKTHGTDPEGNTTGTMDIVCPEGTTIETTGAFGVCQVHKHPQTGLEGITFTNVGNGDVTVDVDITNQIRYTETDTAFCPFGSEPHTTEDGNFVTQVLLEGFEHAGEESHPTTSGGDHPRNTYLTGEPLGIDVE